MGSEFRVQSRYAAGCWWKADPSTGFAGPSPLGREPVPVNKPLNKHCLFRNALELASFAQFSIQAGVAMLKLKKTLRLALLTAVSLVLFVLENQIPAPVPVPGVKLGLGNVIVVAVLFLYGRREALAVLTVKFVLSAVVTGNLGALTYSAGGGLLSWGGMCLLRGLLRPNQLWVASVLGAMLHNLGQLLAAVLIAATPGLWAYLPVLLLSGMVTGFFTGIAAQAVVKRLRAPAP